MSNFLVNDGPLLDEHLLLVHKVAWQVYLQTGYDPDDLYGEGCLQYLVKRPYFNPGESAKFTTFIWIAVQRSLLNYARDRAKELLKIEDAEYVPNKKHRIVERFAMNAF